MEDQRSHQSALNGANSQGPTSPEGKARSARNAEKHGMYSSAIVLNHESSELFTRHQESYHRIFAPANQAESDLVDQLVAASWRLRRINSVETAAIDHAVDAQRAEMDATYESLDPGTRTHFAFEQLHKQSGALQAYQRFQSSQNRQYDRAMKHLRDLQADRKKLEVKTGVNIEILRNEPN